MHPNLQGQESHVISNTEMLLPIPPQCQQRGSIWKNLNGIFCIILHYFTKKNAKNAI